MGKFSKAGGREMPELNTSSLPDLVFAFLFFIMMVTSMREVTLMVQFRAPQATELQKLEKKSLVTFIYVGKPTQEYQAKMGSLKPRLHFDDKFAEVSEIQDYIAQEKSSMKEEDQPFMTVSIKADKETKMGLITDVKQALRDNALKISLILPSGCWRLISGIHKIKKARFLTPPFLLPFSHRSEPFPSKDMTPIQ